jgi:hypothetical protein
MMRLRFWVSALRRGARPFGTLFGLLGVIFGLTAIGVLISVANLPPLWALVVGLGLVLGLLAEGTWLQWRELADRCIELEAYEQTWRRWWPLRERIGWAIALGQELRKSLLPDGISLTLVREWDLDNRKLLGTAFGSTEQLRYIAGGDLPDGDEKPFKVADLLDLVEDRLTKLEVALDRLDAGLTILPDYRPDDWPVPQMTDVEIAQRLGDLEGREEWAG